MANFVDRVHSIAAKGTLAFNITDKRTGEVIHYEDKNLVLQMSNQILAGLIGGDLSKIDRICVGNVATEETIGDTTLSGIDTTTIGLEFTLDGDGLPIIFSQLLTSHEYLTPTTIQYNWEIGYNEANGINITEYGLCNTEGMMFSRKVRGLIEKTEDLALQGTWIIEFLPVGTPYNCPEMPHG